MKTDAERIAELERELAALRDRLAQAEGRLQSLEYFRLFPVPMPPAQPAQPCPLPPPVQPYWQQPIRWYPSTPNWQPQPTWHAEIVCGQAPDQV